MRKHIILASLASASSCLLAGPAFAQAAESPAPAKQLAAADPAQPADAGAQPADAAPPADTNATNAADAAGEQPIVVTGSRIVRNGYTAPTPVTVATTEELVRSTPTNLPDALNRLPQFSNSSSPSRSAHNFANTAANGNVLNLRGLGGSRTLILFDGQRVPPTTFLGTVDTNVIPNLLIQRVDIVTGGASAAYGSDAVSGVVNFVLNRNFTGLTGVAQAGIDQRGNNGNQRVGLAGGLSFANGAGHVLLSAEYFHSGGMLRSDRKSSFGGYTYAGSTVGCVNPNPTTDPTACSAGGSLNPYNLYSDVHLTAASEYGKITAGPFTNFRFTPDGALVPFVNGTLVGTTGYALGGDGYQISPFTQAIAPLKTYQTYGRASYDIGSNVTAYVQGTFTRSDLQYISLANSLVPPQGAVLFSGNPYLPAAIQSAFTPTVQSITLARYGASGPRPITSERTDFWMATAGLEGKFAKDWKWSAAYNHGDSDYHVDQQGVWNWQHFYAASDAVRDASGNIVCRPTLDPDPAIRARYADCKPLNLLIYGKAYEQQPGYAYSVGTSSYRAVNKQDEFDANLQGSLFDLPAGPVDIAVGAQYRHQTLDMTSNADPSLLDTTAERNAYFAGERGVAAASLFYWLTNVGTAHGKQTVKEAYGELAVPILKDTPGFQELSLNAAGRITDYSNSGTVETWKFGATWHPIQDILLRGTVSRDIRAPNLFELFAGDQSAISLLADPVSGITQNVPQVSGGNPNLKPEIAKTFTFGTVLSPRFLPGFSFSADWYKIKIDGAIGTLSLAQIVNNCNASGGSAPECALITRPSPGAFPTQIRVAPANIAFLQTKGIDFDASYRAHVGGGALNLRLYATHLISFQTQQSATAPVLQFSGVNVVSSGPTGYPKWRGTLTADYAVDKFGVTVTEQYIGSMTLGIPGSPQHFVGDTHVSSVFYTDLTLRWDIASHGGNFEFFTTINNLFDKKPPLIPGTIPGVNLPTNFSTYDIVGRAFTGGVRFKF